MLNELRKFIPSSELQTYGTNTIRASVHDNEPVVNFHQITY